MSWIVLLVAVGIAVFVYFYTQKTEKTEPVKGDEEVQENLPKDRLPPSSPTSKLKEELQKQVFSDSEGFSWVAEPGTWAFPTMYRYRTVDAQGNRSDFRDWMGLWKAGTKGRPIFKIETQAPLLEIQRNVGWEVELPSGRVSLLSVLSDFNRSAAQVEADVHLVADPVSKFVFVQGTDAQAFNVMRQQSPNLFSLLGFDSDLERLGVRGAQLPPYSGAIFPFEPVTPFVTDTFDNFVQIS